MNWETSAGTSQVMPAIPGLAIEPCTATARGEAEGDWLCAWCLNRVVNDRDVAPRACRRWSTLGFPPMPGRFVSATAAVSTWAGTTPASMTSLV
jgi:hypothetical protein